MRFVVYGAGAIGGVVGGRLFEHDQEVVLIARGEHHDAIRDHGLRLVAPAADSFEGTDTVSLAIPVVSHPAGIDFRDDDVVLLAMKSQHTGKALSALAATAPPTVGVVCVQNGVANEPAALRLFADVYGVCVVCPALHLDPGVVEAHAGPVTGILDLGRYPRGVDKRAEAIAEVFASSSFDAVARPDIMRWKYSKLLNNLGNAVDALCGPDAEGRELQRRAWLEGAECLQAAGIEPISPEEDAARRGDRFQWGGAAARSRPGASSWQSLARGTGSIEADYLNGEIVLLGRMHGVPTPVNELLQRMAGRAAREGTPPGSISPDELIRMLPDGE
jgi:2-dehydropantoate 2-reductase